MNIDSSSEEFFESKYAAAADPWDFETSAYERNRYTTIVRALQGRRYKRAFEPGCSIGLLTLELARICDSVEAIDISPTAVACARARCAACENVTVRQGKLPGSVPDGLFDLIVFSEIGYYFAADVLTKIVQDLVGRLTPEGLFLAAHWLGVSPDHRLKGDQVHALLEGTPGLTPTFAERHEGFRIERWTRI